MKPTPQPGDLVVASLRLQKMQSSVKKHPYAVVVSTPSSCHLAVIRLHQGRGGPAKTVGYYHSSFWKTIPPETALHALESVPFGWWEWEVLLKRPKSEGFRDKYATPLKMLRDKPSPLDVLRSRLEELKIEILRLEKKTRKPIT